MVSGTANKCINIYQFYMPRHFTLLCIKPSSYAKPYAQEESVSKISRVMKGVQLTAHGGLDKLVFRDDIPVPVPGSRDVLVKVSAAGVNNTDLNTRIGWYSKSNNSNDASWPGSPIVFPRIQGADVCGRVVDVQSVPFYS